MVAFYSVPVTEGETYDGPWVSDVSGDEVVECFADWEPEVMQLTKVRSFVCLSSTLVLTQMQSGVYR